MEYEKIWKIFQSSTEQAELMEDIYFGNFFKNNICNKLLKSGSPSFRGGICYRILWDSVPCDLYVAHRGT
jgi:hypothetical protein